MYFLTFCVLAMIITRVQCGEISIHESDVNFRIDPGSRMCFFEKGKTGHMMEVFYQVLDGQHGDLDISFDVMNPNGVKIVSDYKKSQNSIIMDLELDGDYTFCMDNTFSVMNSKLVFVYVLIEEREKKRDNEAEISVVDEDGKERKMEEVLQWMGTYDNGEPYYIDVEQIAESMSRTLKHVVKARHLLDLYGAGKSRDSYMAFEDTFVVDMWSGFQISFMVVVGMLQVYMIKKLFNSPYSGLENMY